MRVPPPTVAPGARPGAALAALTGWPGEPPVDPPPPVVARLDALAADVARWSAAVGTPVQVDAESILTERARLLGLGRQGRVSANGTCRLLRATDGWWALNLSRPDDLAGVDALVGGTAGDDPWAAVAAAASAAPGNELVARARLLGMPAAQLGVRGAPRPAVAAARRWPAAPGPRGLAGLRVVDLSAMWAGPLAARLLMQAGATVTKVESVARPDGVRGHPDVYGLLHPPGQPEVRLDFARAEGRCHLRALLDEADVVLEGSRPRALEQLGAAHGDVAERPGRIWVGITGYGRAAPWREAVAFGDDAAVAGGLVGRDRRGDPVFFADAVADPVAGLYAAAAILQAVATGGGVLLDVALSHSAASLLAGADDGCARPDGGPPFSVGNTAV